MNVSLEVEEMIYDDYNNVLDRVGGYSIARGLCDPLGMSQFLPSVPDS